MKLMPVVHSALSEYHIVNRIDDAHLSEVEDPKRSVIMPIIPATTTDCLIKEMKDVTLEKVKNPRQCTSDGTTPSNGAAGDGKSNDQPSTNGAQIPNKNWSKEVKQGVEPETGEGRDEDEESSDEGSDEDSSSDDEIKAPIELMGEFLQYVRTSDWENASKLCTMILIYEPDNPEALQFQSVIVEKAKIEKELAEMSSSSDEEEESSEEDTEEEEQQEDVGDEPNGKDDQDSPEEFEPRPGSNMKNKLVFPHSDPVWKP